MIDWSTLILLYLAAMRTPLGLSFFSNVTEFGGGVIVTIVLAVSLFILWRGRAWAHAVGLIVALGGSIAVSEILKNVLQFSRPDLVLHAVVESGYSFPSKHAAAAMALYGFLAWYVWEKHPQWRIPVTLFLGLIILLVGFSRLYLGVHFPADVIGGYLLGIIFIWIGARTTRRLEHFEE
ncbi:MAG: phosphatase PAP2 family protein [bacterium]|nr:phosphatase PAP2 family protein [bacterium]